MVPQNQSESIHKSLVKMSRLLRSKFASKDAFEKAITEQAASEKNDNLSVDEF